MFGAVVCLFLDCLPLTFGAAVFIDDFDICLFSANRFDFLRPLDSTNIMHFLYTNALHKSNNLDVEPVPCMVYHYDLNLYVITVSHIRSLNGQQINQQICLCVSFKYYSFWALNCYLMKKNSSVLVLNLNILIFLNLYTELFALGGT